MTDPGSKTRSPKLPGPDHPITIAPALKRWRALFHNHLIADSGDAVVLREANYPPVVYFPREDLRMEYLHRTDHATYCPYKGDAAYYTLARDGEVIDNAVWTYETPYPAMAQIAGRLAFYPQNVELYEVDEADLNPQARPASEVDQAVLHTDSGSGQPQREPWPPNVPGPRDGGVR